jgi:hypothetical protein
MRILFFIEPLLMHNRPFHYWAWLDYSASIYRAFSESDMPYDFRFIMGEGLALRALAPYDPAPRHPPLRGQGLPVSTVVPFAQEPIRAIFDAPNSEILDGLHHGRWTGAQLARYGELVRDRMGEFVPDVIITRTPVPFLSLAYPDAVVFGTECGPFSRRPYPMTTFLDPCGLWEESIPGAYARELLARPVSEDDHILLARIRAHYRSFFTATSPFHPLEEEMRRRYRRVAFLPLQFAGESGFDLNAPFRSQGEYLFHVLERIPPGLGLLVVEHPTAIWIGDSIDEETRDYVSDRYPQVVFVDHRTIPSAGQYLIHHADYVFCVSSSLGLQAVLWAKPMIAVGRCPYRAFATFASVDAIDLSVESDTGPCFEGALAWLLRHYYAHERYGLHDALWLDRFFRTIRERRREGRSGLDLFEPIASMEEVAEGLCAELPSAHAPETRTVTGLLLNGDFISWSEGHGPFRTAGVTADGWELLPGAGNKVVVKRGDLEEVKSGPDRSAGHYLSLERAVARGEPTLILQRVPDVHRCADHRMRVRLWARSAGGHPLLVYAYQQFDSARTPSRGTQPRTYHLTVDWKAYEYETIVPSTEGMICGPGSHTEIVFGLPGDAGPGAFDLALVEMV